MKKRLRQFLFGSSIGNSNSLNIGWLLFRLHVGLSIAIHAGFPKMNDIAAPGWFVDQVAGLGFNFPSPAFWAAMASWGEFVGGILIAVGLFTRFAAVQLAFQFFVIAFLWYDKPEPLTGMYFQQLYFWCYVLISFAGAGKFSFDNLIMKKWEIKSPVFTKTAIVSLFLLFGLSSQAQEPVVKIDDVKIVEGRWIGQLTYLDYSSNKSESIRASMEVTIKNASEFSFNIFYTDEPKKNGRDKYVIKADGTFINKRKVIERSIQPDGSLKIVLEEKGTDGNDHKPATFHQILLLGKNNFSITKMVKFDGEENFFQRNQYVFTR